MIYLGNACLAGRLRACIGLRLRNRAFKSKRAFEQKLHFQAFAKSAFWQFLGFLDP
jgi:hypothetical protein